MAKGSRNRVVQHKSERDTASPLKENRALKQENKSLKRQLSKLRKQIGKMMESHMAIQQMVAEEPVETLVPGQGPESAVGCSACASTNVAIVELPMGTLSVCRTCGIRKVQRHE